MPSLIENYKLEAPAFAPKKRKTIDETLREIGPMLADSAENIKQYNDRTARQKEVDAAIAGGNEGFEWFNGDDPAHKAVIEEYVRTGNASGLAQQRGMWQNSQALKAEKEAGVADRKKGLLRSFNRGIATLDAWKGAEPSPEATAQINLNALSAQEAIDDLAEAGEDVTELQAQLDAIKGVKQAAVDSKVDEIAAKEAAAEQRKAERAKALNAAKAEFKTLTPAQQKRVKDGATYKGFSYKELK